MGEETKAWTMIQIRCVCIAFDELAAEFRGEETWTCEGHGEGWREPCII